MAVTTPPPKKFFNPSPIDLDTYKSSGVDFYTQALDLKTLTGVGIDDDGGDSTDLREYGIAGEDGGESPTQDDAINALGGINIQATPKEIAQGKTSMFPGGTGIEYNKFDYVSHELYSDYLSSGKPQGYEDRVGFTKNILEPLVDGRLSDIDFAAGTKGLADRVGEALTETATKADAKTAGKAYLAAQGPMLALAGSAIFSTETRQNAFGSTSARPDGILGLVADTVHATQYQDMAHNRAVARAVMSDFRESVSGMTEDRFQDDSLVGTFAADRDLGFSMKFGSGIGATGITRKAGTFTYTGNLRGLDNQTLKNIEAVQRGFIPSTFGRSNFGFDYTGKGATTFEGGGYSDALTSDGDRYTDDGKYMDGFGRVSMVGRASDFTNFTSQYAAELSSYGATKAEIEALARGDLDGARAGKGKLGDLKAKTIADYISKSKATKAQADARNFAAEAAAKAAAAKAAMPTINPYSPSFGTGAAYDDGGYDDSGLGDGRDDASTSTAESTEAGMEEGDARGGMITHGRPQNRNAYAMGSRVESGFIDRPPSQVSEAGKVADDKPLKAPEGSYVLNAAAIEHMGEADVRKMIMDAQKEAVRRGVSTDDFERHSDLIDIAISSGEAIIAPHLVKIIGEDRLEKINKRGLRKTEERVQRTKQEKPVAVSGGGFISRKKFAKGSEVLPRSNPLRKKEALADVELRADLEEYMQNDNLARLGFDLYEKGLLDVSAIVLPRRAKENIKVGTGGMFSPAKSTRGVQPRREATGDDRTMMNMAIAQGTNIDMRKPVGGVTYFVNEAKNYTRSDANLILLHELRHAALDYIFNTYNIPEDKRPTIGREEYLFNAQDYLNREQARKVKPSISKTYSSDSKQGRASAAASTVSSRPELQMYQDLAQKILKDRKVPPRTKSKEVEGFFDRAMGLLGL